MSVPPSRAQSDVFGVSASQYGGTQTARKPKISINYFLIPIFVLEVIGLACLWALFYYLRFTDLFPYNRRVFHCADVRLMKPNLKPEEYMYMSESLLYCLSFIVPPIVIVIGEIMFWLFSTKPRKTVYANCRECKVHLFTRRVLRFICVFMFGALIVCIFIDTIKLITGYQRPYFLSLCNVTAANCDKFNHAQFRDPLRSCLNHADTLGLRYAWLTFPSLYAGLSSFCMIFASLYVHYMINMRGAPLLRPFLIFFFLTFTLFASFVRINGYKNHWVDIWVGWLIGAVTAFYLCFNVLCFQEVYHIPIEKPAIVEERISPFFSWFRLPRVTAPSRKESNYSVYEEESPAPQKQRSRDQNRTYEVTTTTESFHRTISPPSHVGNGISY